MRLQRENGDNQRKSCNNRFLQKQQKKSMSARLKIEKKIKSVILLESSMKDAFPACQFKTSNFGLGAVVLKENNQ